MIVGVGGVFVVDVVVSVPRCVPSTLTLSPSAKHRMFSHTTW